MVVSENNQVRVKLADIVKLNSARFSAIFMLQLLMVAGLLRPATIRAQINMSQVVMTPTPGIDSVTYDCENGIAVVIPSTDIPGTIFHVRSLQPSDLPVPPPNETGVFLIPGLKQGVFYAQHLDCESVDFTLSLPCYEEPYMDLDFRAVKAGIERARLDLDIYTDEVISAIEIERSANGLHFSRIQEIQPVNNGPDAHHYTSFDELPWKGYNYYRARISNDSGWTWYSPIRMLYFGNGDGREEILYPNPNNGHFYLQLNSETTELNYEIRNILGHVVIRDSKKGDLTSTYSFHIDLLPAAFYLLSYSKGGDSTWRIVKFEVVD